jgi:hypothetical protein
MIFCQISKSNNRALMWYVDLTNTLPEPEMLR